MTNNIVSTFDNPNQDEHQQKALDWISSWCGEIWSKRTKKFFKKIFLFLTETLVEAFGDH